MRASHNGEHVCEALDLCNALRLALAQAISLTNLLRPPGRLGPPPVCRAGFASDRKSGYQRGYGMWVMNKTPNEINRMERRCC